MKTDLPYRLYGVWNSTIGTWLSDPVNGLTPFVTRSKVDALGYIRKVETDDDLAIVMLLPCPESAIAVQPPVAEVA